MRARLAEGRDGGDNELGMLLAERRVVELPVCELPRRETLEEQLGSPGELAESVAIARGVEIQHQAALVGGVVEKRKADARAAACEGATLPLGVAARGFYQNHIGSEVGQELSAKGGLFVAQLENEHAIEGRCRLAGHGSRISFVSRAEVAVSRR